MASLSARSGPLGQREPLAVVLVSATFNVGDFFDERGGAPNTATMVEPPELLVDVLHLDQVCGRARAGALRRGRARATREKLVVLSDFGVSILS